MSANVDALAKSYLLSLVQKGARPVPAVHEDSRTRYAPASPYSEDARSMIERLDKEFKAQRKEQERYEIEDLPDKFILQNGQKYLYGIHKSQTKWTYDPKLATTLSAEEVEILTPWLDLIFKTPVTMLPAPAREGP